jgi:predicted esterase
MLPYIFTGSLLLLALSTYPQMNPAIRYKDEFFPSLKVQKDLSYSSGKAHRFDWYEPTDDTATARPLIIWMHGGGFKFGSKNMHSIRLWSDFFARRGYVCAAINYQLGKKDLRFKYDDLVRNCENAVGDCREAIAWFKRNAARLRIVTSRIILAGNSAGGMIALQTAYGIEPGGVAAVINFWGGIFDRGWLQRARVPIVSVHGRNDNIVPYDHKGYPLYGSGAIHPIADSLHIPNRLKTYEGYSHELQKHFNPLIVSRLTKKRWLEAGQFAADFLYDELFNR